MRNKSNEVKEFSEIVDIISRCDTIRIAMFDDPLQTLYWDSLQADHSSFLHSWYECRKQPDHR